MSRCAYRRSGFVPAVWCGAVPAAASGSAPGRVPTGRPRCRRRLSRGALVIAALGALLTQGPLAGASQCSGDCNGDGAVTIEEIVVLVNIANGDLPLSRCPAADGTADGMVTIDDIVVAVANAAMGCAAVPTPTATALPTATEAPTPTPRVTNPTAVRGVCRRPGPGGLEACVDGTRIRVAVCEVGRECLSSRAAQRELAETLTVGGQFCVMVDGDAVGGRALVVSAEIDGAAVEPFRSVTFPGITGGTPPCGASAAAAASGGIDGSGGRARPADAVDAAGDDGVVIDPSSEGAVRAAILAPESVPVDDVPDLAQRVREDSRAQYAGLTAECAAQLGTEIALALVREIIRGASFDGPSALAVDGAGNLYVAAYASNNVFRVAPDGETRMLLDARGGDGQSLVGPSALTVDRVGNLYVAGGQNVFRVAPDGTTRVILDAAGADRSPLRFPSALASDSAGNVYVADALVDTVFRVGPEGAKRIILDAGGSGGESLRYPGALAVDGAGNVYVAGFQSHNVFRVEPDGMTRVIFRVPDDGSGLGALAVDEAGNVFALVAGPSGDRVRVFRIAPDGTRRVILDHGGGQRPEGASALAVDGAGNVFVGGYDSANVFRVASDGATRVILDEGGVGGHPLSAPSALAVDTAGNVYVAGELSDNVFRVASDGTKRVVLDADTFAYTPGGGGALSGPLSVGVDDSGNLYVAGIYSRNVFRVAPDGVTHVILDADGVDGRPLFPVGLAVGRDGTAYVNDGDFVFRVAPNGAKGLFLAGADLGGGVIEGGAPLALDGAGNVYVSVTTDLGQPYTSGTVVRVAPEGTKHVLLDKSGAFGRALVGAGVVVVDGTGSVYISGTTRVGDSIGYAVFRVAPDGTKSIILDDQGADGQRLQGVAALAVDGASNVYVAGGAATQGSSPLVLRVAPDGTTRVVLDAAGADGQPLSAPHALVADVAGNVYVADSTGSNVFRVGPQGTPRLIVHGRSAEGPPLVAPVSLAADRAGNVYVAGFVSNNVVRITPCGFASDVSR